MRNERRTESRRPGRGWGVALVLSAAMVIAATGMATAAMPDQTCKAGKNKIAGKYAACRAGAEAKLVLSGDDSKYNDSLDACESKFSKAWQKLEDKATAAGVACPADDGLIGGQTVAYTSRVAGLVAGIRFVDNDDGTVTDRQTGLQWEKKTALDGAADASNPHDADNVYTWTAGSTAPDGTAYTDFLVRLNGASADGVTLSGCFADHCDWRLPTVVELAGIVDTDVAGCGSGSPCIPSTFGPTVANHHWTATSETVPPDFAWLITFLSGLVDEDPKTATAYVRAVRGGS